MPKFDLLKTFKIAFGCCLGYMIAQLLGLNYSTSVITITLLSILNTKKETLTTARKRLLAFFGAAFLSFFIFQILYDSLLSIFLYLIFYYLYCQYFKCVEGFSMSTVLMLHLWKAGIYTIPALLNEFFLMLIVIFMAILMNLYMPNRIKLIRAAQKDMERQISTILFTMSKSIFHDKVDENIASQLEKLQTTLAETYVHAKYTENNFIFKDMSYYSSYIQMRFSQYELLKRIHINLPRLKETYHQTALVSTFMNITAVSMHEYNNAEDLLHYLSTLRIKFKAAPLPKTRIEFESRAILFEIVNELEEILMLKKQFADNLTPYQIETFWKHQNT